MIFWFIMMAIQAREYWKGVEKLRFNNDRVEFRFMYWARKKGQADAK
jgi:hypothetical protein